jgi:restriction system protein
MEELVARILRAMGYKAKVSLKGPDRGVDVIASPDGLGLTQPRIKEEVKHRGGSMGAPAIRGFIGALREGDSGLFISTG